MAIADGAAAARDAGQPIDVFISYSAPMLPTLKGCRRR